MRGGVGRYRSYAAALFCYVLALMSREYCIILPMVLVLLIYFSADRSKRVAHLVHTAPFFLAAVLFYAIYQDFAVSANFITPSQESFHAETISKMSVATKIMLFYLVRMVTGLGAFTLDDSAGFALIATLVIAGLLFAAFRVRRAYPHLLFGLLFYLICLIPVLNLFKTFPIVSPRYSFLPCIGLFFTLLAVPYEGRKRLFLPLCIVLTLAWSILTIQKTYYWKNNISFWESMTARDEHPYTYMQLGYAYYDGRQYEKAQETLRNVQPAPWDPRYHATVGGACFKLADYKCAIRSFETALSQGAGYDSVPPDLAKPNPAMGDRANAERYFDLVDRNFPWLKEEAEKIKKGPS